MHRWHFEVCLTQTRSIESENGITISNENKFPLYNTFNIMICLTAFTGAYQTIFGIQSKEILWQVTKSPTKELSEGGMKTLERKHQSLLPRWLKGWSLQQCTRGQNWISEDLERMRMLIRGKRQYLEENRKCGWEF